MKLLHLYLTVVCHLSHPVLSQPQQVVTVTVAAPIPSNEPEWRDEDRFTSAVLNSTNTYRSQHGAADVVWNGTLAEFADDYLDGGDCVFEHSGGPYGENLAMGYPNATASVEAWGDERDEYDFGRQGFDKETGHFTQLVWRNTTDVGCARRLCGRDGWFLACEYWPQGNVEGQYEAAVGRREGGAVGLVRSWGMVGVGLVVCVVGLW
ncbi:unnamed protein product [Clonostachys rosea f. rosea IK726]|uniref:Uncharacterized protein n=1 Tax=Clonostachys rosea f. rosea IK726 TaxID=1349383 RepID=A0ACA9TKQ3_BIOOC|nr:unnamed protein product [Clonostachys rosea f. rosea IK726]